MFHRTPRVLLALALGSSTLLVHQFIARACSVVLWNTNPTAVVVARTYDWTTNYDESLWVLPRGMQRSGMSGDNPATWTSAYGSVVVAEGGVIVSDGINEAGLSGHVLYMDGTQYPAPDPSLPDVSSGIWLQYFLDNYANVNDVVAHVSDVQMVFVPFGGYESMPLHLAFEDSTGDSAVVEFVNGATVVHHGPQYNVMTNDPPLDQQLANLSNYQAFGGTIAGLPGGIQPEDRFVRASYFLQHLPVADTAETALAYVAGIANNVSVPFGAPYVGDSSTYPTWWTTAADLSNLTYYFHSTLSPNVYWVELSNLELSPGAPA
jgi:penicillin V acylase-like amidase (Ntn superfamily)